jgi:hypothetical protein
MRTLATGIITRRYVGYTGCDHQGMRGMSPQLCNMSHARTAAECRALEALTTASRCDSSKGHAYALECGSKTLPVAQLP